MSTPPSREPYPQLPPSLLSPLNRAKTFPNVFRWDRFCPILVAATLLSSLRAEAQEPVIVVGTNTYSAYRADLAPGAWVYVDADSAGATPVRAMQRALGYREVEYKSAVYPTLYFNAITPATNGAIVTYD